MAIGWNGGVLAPGRWRWLRALAWMLLMVVALVAVLALQAVARTMLGVDNIALPTLGLIVLLLAYLAYAGLVRWGERRRAAELALRVMPRELALGLLVGAGMFALVFTGLRLLGLYTLAAGNWSDWPHDIREAIGTGLAEELLFRLVLFRLLIAAFGRWPALLLSAAFFGAAHLANPHASPVAAIAIAIEAGLMLGAFYLLTGRVWMSVGVHAAWNFMQGAVFGAAVSGQAETGSLFASAPAPGAPAWASGGAFGPEASPVAMLIGGAVFGIVMARLGRSPDTSGPATMAHQWEEQR